MGRFYWTRAGVGNNRSGRPPRLDQATALKRTFGILGGARTQSEFKHARRTRPHRDMMRGMRMLLPLVIGFSLLASCKSGLGGRCENGGDQCRAGLVCVDDPQPPGSRCPGAFECPGTCREPPPLP